MNKSLPLKLHLISFDVPFPPDYGGVIDVFYKIKNLAEAGAEIYLHCFEYGRERSENELKKYCKKVWYYPRKTGWAGFSFSRPYMMHSRRDDDLIHNLLSVEAPIVFEGIHSCSTLHHPVLKGRKKIVRNQNVEQDYFARLGQRTTNLFEKMYYKWESVLLKRVEAGLDIADALWTVSKADCDFFIKLYPQKQIEFIPSFQPFNEVESLTGKGDFILYHGNLGHPENKDAVNFLMEDVFPKSNIPVTIAGKNPAVSLKDKIKRYPHIRLIENPEHALMQDLMKQAHIHILPTFQATGIKLKLLQSLFAGRFVLVNDHMLHGTRLEAVCEVANDPQSILSKIEFLKELPFTEELKSERQKLLSVHYDCRANAQRMMNFLQS